MKVRSDIVLQASGRAGTANEGQNLAGRQPSKSLKHRIEHQIVLGNENAQCETCGEDDFSPNIEAWEISGQIVCNECAEEIFEDNGQFGVGA